MGAKAVPARPCTIPVPSLSCPCTAAYLNRVPRLVQEEAPPVRQHGVAVQLYTRKWGSIMSRYSCSTHIKGGQHYQAPLSIPHTVLCRYYVVLSLLLPMHPPGGASRRGRARRLAPSAPPPCPLPLHPPPMHPHPAHLGVLHHEGGRDVLLQDGIGHCDGGGPGDSSY